MVFLWFSTKDLMLNFLNRVAAWAKVNASAAAAFSFVPAELRFVFCWGSLDVMRVLLDVMNICDIK